MPHILVTAMPSAGHDRAVEAALPERDHGVTACTGTAYPDAFGRRASGPGTPSTALDVADARLADGRVRREPVLEGSAAELWRTDREPPASEPQRPQPEQVPPEEEDVIVARTSRGSGRRATVLRRASDRPA